MEAVGRYRIEHRIGEGAMADVYRAHDPGIGRDIAVKVLKRELCRNEEVVARFLREAKAAGALSHPGIVTIYDVGEADGFPYIAMELLDGEPLDELLQRGGRLPLRDALGLGAQLADALGYAHGLGVVHRDIKPSNIMLCDGGRSAKILDFGIARLGEPDPLRAEINLLRTQIGQVLGTPRYMSPEQALGLKLDYRTDLFSLGAVLQEMITGKPAFDGGSIATIAIQITREAPSPVRDTVRDCPAGVQQILSRLMAHQVEKRFPSGAAAAEALRRELAALDTEKPQRRGPLSLQLRVSLMMGAVTAAVLLVSTAAVLNRQLAAMERMALTSGRSVATFVADNVALRAAENASLPEELQDWIPVQAFVASASNDPNIMGLLVVDSKGIVRAAGDMALVGSAWHPDGEGRVLSETPDGTAYALGERAFRLERTIAYAGRDFGSVELTVDRKELNAAARASRNMMIGLGIGILLAVMLGSYAIARALAQPIRRLRAALDDAAAGGANVRISHRRNDEFGELFDGFNSLLDRYETGAPGSPPPSPPENLEATRIGPAPPLPEHLRRSA